MALRQRKWAQRKTTELRQQLGGKCIDCGTTENLTFDVIRPNEVKHHKEMDPSWRLSFYRQQFREGNLALRCIRCNAHKSKRDAILTEIDISRHYLKNWRVIKLEYIRL